MRVAGRIAAQALQGGRPSHRTRGDHRPARPDRSRVPLRPRRVSLDNLGYRGFPKSLCTSLNEVICHGIPDSTVVSDGDIVNIDITAFIGGVHGDTNATFLAGDVDEQSRLLVERTTGHVARDPRSQTRAERSTWWAGSSSRTRNASAAGSSAISPVTGSARRSIPGSSSRITTTVGQS